jgi:hypothetical protein
MSRWSPVYVPEIETGRHVKINACTVEIKIKWMIRKHGFSIKKTSKVNTILKVVIFKNYVILFRCSMICRWPEP